MSGETNVDGAALASHWLQMMRSKDENLPFSNLPDGISLPPPTTIARPAQEGESFKCFWREAVSDL